MTSSNTATKRRSISRPTVPLVTTVSLLTLLRGRKAASQLYAVFNKPKLTEHPVITEIANKLGATPAQVLIAWGVYRGYSVIPKSVQEERLVSNFKQVELSKEDYEKIWALGAKEHTRFAFRPDVLDMALTLTRRFNIPYAYSKPNWNVNVFNEPEEQSAKYKPNLGI